MSRYIRPRRYQAQGVRWFSGLAAGQDDVSPNGEAEGRADGCNPIACVEASGEQDQERGECKPSQGDHGRRGLIRGRLARAMAKPIMSKIR